MFALRQNKPKVRGAKAPANTTSKANYYFGAPVTNAKVKLKILRSNYSTTWYPWARWDWLYSTGYWWFAYDSPWYPGWDLWGCARPFAWWWPRAAKPPELVMDAEMAIGEDGTAKIVIDSAMAKAMHGNEDHQYTITAEVTDRSRRTIVGSGQVIAARQPFRVFAWVDRGWYKVGDAIQANFQARTPDGKPVAGKGKATLYRVTYNKKNMPREKKVSEKKLKTNEETPMNNANETTGGIIVSNPAKSNGIYW